MATTNRLRIINVKNRHISFKTPLLYKINNVLFLALVALLIGTAARADTVQGRVVDAETKEPLPDASVTFTQYSDYGYSMQSMKTDSISFTYHLDAKKKD